MSHGQNQIHTPGKEDSFAGAFARSLKISAVLKLRDWPYWHLDLNAGSGFNDLADCKGSPLVFLDVATAIGRKVNAYFCDHDVSLTDQLSNRLDKYSVPQFVNISVECVDNGFFLEGMAGVISARENPDYAVGTLLCDPNGLRKGFPFREIAAFAAMFPRIDLIQSLNFTLFRSALGCKRKGKKGFLDWPELDEVIPWSEREFWLIRNPPRAAGGRGGHVFTTLVGSNKNGGKSRRRGFYDIRSSVGRAILEDMKHQAVNQPFLFPETNEERP